MFVRTNKDRIYYVKQQEAIFIQIQPMLIFRKLSITDNIHARAAEYPGEILQKKSLLTIAHGVAIITSNVIQLV